MQHLGAGLVCRLPLLDDDVRAFLITLLGNRRCRWALFALWCLGWCAIIVASLAPGVQVGPTVSDKTLHFAGYAAMVAGSVGFCVRRRHLVLVTLLAIALGAVLEMAQGMVPGRFVELGDALANGLGAGFGLLVAVVLLTWLRAPAAALRNRAPAANP